MTHDPDDLSGRVRVLSAAEPLHTLQPTAHRAPFDQLDHHHLGLTVLRLAIDSQSPRGRLGAIERDALINEVGRAVRIQLKALAGAADDLTTRDIQDHAARIVHHLMNLETGRPFEKRVYNPDSGNFESFRYALLLEQEDEDGAFYVEPTTQALNLYFHSTATSLEDQNVALNALLTHYMNKGLFDRALAQARDRRRLAARLKRDVELRIQRMRVSLRRVSFQEDVGPLLARARTQSDEMIESENQILGFVTEYRDNPDLTSDQQVALGQIHAITQDNRGLYLALRNKIVVSERTFGEEFERQGFRFRIAKTLPSVEEEILAPAMRLPATAAGDPWSAVIGAFAAPRPSKVFDLTAMVRLALQPKRERQSYVDAEEPGELEEIAHMDDFVTPEGFQEALQFVWAALETYGPLSLSMLIRGAERSGLSRNQQASVALICHDAFKDAGRHDLDAEAREAGFDAGFCAGTDLQVRLHGGQRGDRDTGSSAAAAAE